MLAVMQDTSRVRLYDSLSVYYLAVRGVNEKHQTLRAAYFYALTLASALWVNRLTMLEVAGSGIGGQGQNGIRTRPDPQIAYEAYV
jgi:hypothetical protein